MKLLVRLVSCFLSVSAAAVIGLHVVPQAVRSSEMNPWRLMESSCLLNAERTRCEALSRRNRDILGVLRVKSEIIDDLIHERIRFWDAAEQFRLQSEANDQFDWNLFRRQFAGESDKERFGRQVISHVQAVLREDAERRDRLVQEYMGELESPCEIIIQDSIKF